MTESDQERTPAPDEKELDEPTRTERWFFLCVIAAGIGFLWVRYLQTSFWLDEAGTFWVVQDGFSDVIERSRFQGQSPAYYVIAWAARLMFGRSEIALRLPSIMAAAAAVYLVYRLGRRLWDEPTGMVAAAAFVVLAPMAFAAVDARPYALAVLCLAAATLCLVRWQQERALRFAAGYVLLSSAMLYFSYFFFLAFAAHGAYVYDRARSEDGVGLRSYLYSLAGVGLLLSPSFVHLGALLGQSDILAWVIRERSVWRFIAPLFPAPFIAGVAAAAVVMRLRRGWKQFEPDRRGGGTLAVAWAYFPPELLFILSVVVAPKFFQPRYYVSFAPGIAMLFAFVIRGLSDRVGRRAAVLGLVVVGLLTFNGGFHRAQDWRTASSVINRSAGEDTPVLVTTGLSSRRTDDPERRGLLLAPFAPYPVTGRLILLPFDLSPDNAQTLSRIVNRELIPSGRFLLVIGFEGDAKFQEYLEQLLLPSKFSVHRLFKKEIVRVMLFVRDR
jgi:uncharacterized membrane protein